MPITWHVSISHPPAERERAVRLAERLLAVGVAVALDEWQPSGASASGAAAAAAAASSRAGGRGTGSWSEVLLVSPAALVEPWSARLAQRLLAGAVAGRRRLVPVVVGAVEEIPAPLASRPWADFRDDPAFASTARLWTLVAMLRGERADSPPPGEWPAAFEDEAAAAAVGTAPCRVGILLHADRVLVHAAGRELTLELAGDDPGEITERLTGGDAAALLREAFAVAGATAARVELSITHPPWQALPWESELPRALVAADVVPAGRPLAVVRVQRTRAVATQRGDAGPLEVLVVLSSPESRHGMGSRVDPAAAARFALAAVAPACAAAPVRVELRERALLDELTRAVAASRPHVVMVVAASRQGQLVLHREDDREERVSAARLVAEGLGDGADAPLVIVAQAPASAAHDGPASASAAAARDGEGDVARIAHELVEAGVPAAIAVADLERSAASIATALARLARGGVSIVDALPAGGEGAAPLLVASALVRPALVAGATDGADGAPAPAPTAPRRPELVGRRAELRALRRIFVGAERAGAWLAGPAGIGKSALARELARRLDDTRRVAVELSGELAPEDVIEAIGRRLDAHLRRSYERDDPEAEGREPLKALASFLTRADVPWRERWERLVRELAGRLSALVILDGFERNQDEHGEVREPALAELLASWPREAGAPRLLVVARQPPPPSEALAARLETVELGPLDAVASSWVRLGLAHLGALDGPLAAAVVERAGGHPRWLELLDRVAARAGRAALARLVEVPPASLARTALAMTIEGLAGTLAPRVLTGALAYRVPVDALGLGWCVATPAETAMDAARRERLARFLEAIQAARARGEEPTISSLGLSRDDQRVLEADIAARLKPPVELPEGLDAAVAELAAAGLLETGAGAEGPVHHVPRWIREELAASAGGEVLAAAHRHAARYWHWRIKTLPRPAHADLADTLELRHHLLCAGEDGWARQIAEVACAHLDAMGAIERAERLCRASLEGLASGSAEAAPFEHQLAIAARKRGRVSEARARILAAAALEEERGDRGGLLRSWGELGILATIDGDLGAANEWFQKARAAASELGEVDAEAASLHHLALLSRERGALDEARERAERALALRENAVGEGDLGAVLLTLGDVERARRAFDAASAALVRALVLARTAGDVGRIHRATMALAGVARDREQPEEAARQLGLALDAALARGDRGAAAEAASELARLAERKGAIDDAWSSFRRALEISERDGDRDAMIAAYLDLARVDQRRGHSIDALGWAVHAVASALTTGSARSRDALEVLAAQARVVGGGKRWRASWRRAFDADPPTEVVAWVEASWWRRVQRRRRQQHEATRPSVT